MNLAYDFTPSCPIPLPWSIRSNQEDILALEPQKEVAVPEFKELAINGQPSYKIYDTLKLNHPEYQRAVPDLNRGNLSAQIFLSFLSREVNLAIKWDFFYHVRYMPTKICHSVLCEVSLVCKEKILTIKSCLSHPKFFKPELAWAKIGSQIWVR